jgi:tetratricopeptide (TPR) repeat protein
MAVLVEAISVIVRKSAIADRYPHGIDGFRHSAPNATFCEDESLVRVGFMVPDDAREYIEQLEACGLVYFENDRAVDIVVADQTGGLLVECDWAKFVRMPCPSGEMVAACTSSDDAAEGFAAVPRDWIYDRSFTNSSIPIGPKEAATRLEFIGLEDGVYKYLDKATGKVVYAGSPSASQRQAEFEKICDICQRALELEQLALDARERDDQQQLGSVTDELKSRLCPLIKSMVPQASFHAGFAHFALGLVLRILYEREAALEEFHRSLSYSPDAENTLLEVVRCLGELGREGEALPYALRCVEAAPESPGAWGNLAAVHMGLGQGEAALAAIERAIELDPDDQINQRIVAALRSKRDPTA